MLGETEQALGLGITCNEPNTKKYKRSIGGIRNINFFMNNWFFDTLKSGIVTSDMLFLWSFMANWELSGIIMRMRQAALVKKGWDSNSGSMKWRQRKRRALWTTSWLYMYIILVHPFTFLAGPLPSAVSQPFYRCYFLRSINSFHHGDSKDTFPFSLAPFKHE